MNASERMAAAIALKPVDRIPNAPFQEAPICRYFGRGTVVIGTVKGDLHDIGKNLVTMMMEGAEFEVVDLGVDVDRDNFIKTAAEENAHVIALSALLTTTMPSMENTVNSIKEAGLATKTIIGGAPVTQAFADQIGADGFSSDAPGGG